MKAAGCCVKQIFAFCEHSLTMDLEAVVSIHYHNSEDINFYFRQILQPVWEDSKTYTKFEVFSVVMLKI
jgi:hypothetical protein